MRMVTTIGDLGQSERIHQRGAVVWVRLPDDPTDGIGDLMGLVDGGEGGGDGDGPIYVPVLVPPVGPAWSIPEPEAPAEKAPSSGALRAAALVKSAWLSDGRYVLQSGDTLSRLALAYLASANRWREIWAVQSANYKASRTPDRIYAGDVVAMPGDAQAKARALGFIGIGTGLLGLPVGFTKKQVAIAAAGVAGVGGLLWLVGRG